MPCDTKGVCNTPEEFENIVIRATCLTVRYLRLKDIADSRIRPVGLWLYQNRVNGHQGSNLQSFIQTAGYQCYDTPSSDIQELPWMKRQPTLPPGVEVVTLSMNANDFLFASIHEVLKTLLEAFVLVFISGIYLLAGFSFYLDSDHCNSGSAYRYFLRSVT